MLNETQGELAAPAPVSEQARISSVDILRGFALLGILAMNIYSFALPGPAYENMVIYGGSTGINRIVWYITHIFFQEKMMTIFSMLFGAGLILMMNRFEESGRDDFKKFYYRRSFWLLMIALVHAYFIWWGDILFYYAITGFLMYFFRNLSARKLILTASILLIIGIFMLFGIGTAFTYMRQTAKEAQELIDQGETLDKDKQAVLDNWQNIEEGLMPDQESIQHEIDAYRGGYWSNFNHRSMTVIDMQTMSFLFYILWRVGAIMMIGMALMKMGIFSALKSRKFYLMLIIIGYGVGLPLVYFGATRLELHSFDRILMFREDGLFNYVFSIAVALGHIGLIMLICKSNILATLKKSLAAVGRMALTNYLMHSIVFTTIFYGFGFGLFGKLQRAELMPYVIGMWIFQMIVSPLWLKYFKFGPAEWLWRSLTYKQLQPMSRV